MPEGLSGTVMFLAIMIGGMYFLMIRPQQKREKEVRQMRSSLNVGDKIITIGGIKGKILKIGEDYVVIESSNSKTRIEFVKSAIGSVIKDENYSEIKEDNEELNEKSEETEDIIKENNTEEE